MSANTRMDVCRTCGRDVDLRAKNCPHCGRKWPTLSTGFQWLRVAMIVAAIALVLIFLPSIATVR